MDNLDLPMYDYIDSVTFGDYQGHSYKEYSNNRPKKEYFCFKCKQRIYFNSLYGKSPLNKDYTRHICKSKIR